MIMMIWVHGEVIYGVFPIFFLSLLSFSIDLSVCSRLFFIYGCVSMVLLLDVVVVWSVLFDKCEFVEDRICDSQLTEKNKALRIMVCWVSKLK